MNTVISTNKNPIKTVIIRQKISPKQSDNHNRTLVLETQKKYYDCPEKLVIHKYKYWTIE